MFLVRLGTSGGQEYATCSAAGAKGLGTVQLWCASSAHRAQLLSPSTFPAASQVTDTGRLLHTLPGRSHLSHSVPQASCSPAGSLVRSHPSFHSPVPGILLGVENNQSYKKLKKPLAQRAQTLSKMTLGPEQADTSTKTSETLDRLRCSGLLLTAQACGPCPFFGFSLLTHRWLHRLLRTRVNHRNTANSVEKKSLNLTTQRRASHVCLNTHPAS